MPQTAKEVFKHVVQIKSSSDDPITVDLWHDTKQFRTTAELMYGINGEHRTVPAGFHFDGASIPRAFWGIAGFSPLDRDTLPAACIHDYLLDHSAMRRVMADAWFVSVLCGATLNGRSLPQCSQRRARLMYVAVRAYAIGLGICRSARQWCARTDDAGDN